MNKNVSALFCLIKAGLWEQGIQLSALGDIGYDEVFRLAEEQSVLGLVTAGMEHVTDVKIPQEVLLQFIGSTLQIEQQNQNMNEFVAQLTDLLRIEGINSLLVKGQGIAQCYEKPLWRASGDVDLLLDRANYEKAKKLLLARSETAGNEVVDELHLGMTINRWEVELHGTLHSELSFKLDKQIDEIQIQHQSAVNRFAGHLILRVVFIVHIADFIRIPSRQTDKNGDAQNGNREIQRFAF